MKEFFKVILLTVIVSIVSIFVAVLMPHSESFREINSDSGLIGFVSFLVVNFFCCCTIFYVIRNSEYSGIKTIICLSISLPCIYMVMTQIETLFFASAFPVLTRKDVLLMIFSNSFPLLVGILIGNKLFTRNKKTEGHKIEDKTFFPMKELAIKVLIIGVLYAIIYFLFGYFVAWQSEDLRVFYSGSPFKESFLDKLISNYNENPFIYLFQIIRGILFALFILPIVYLFRYKSKTLLVSIILIYEITAICLIIPNGLFPDSVRWAHFMEMSNSMLLFAFTTWYIYDKMKIKTKRADKI